MDIEGFYAADERRRSSEEVELGREWRDEGGHRYELSWVADTGELYAMLEPSGGEWVDPFGDMWPVGSVRTGELSVAVLGVVADRATLERLLDGWQEAMGRPDGIRWVAERLSAAGVRP
ncbi:MAG TPA: hypothetical protein VFP54_10735 [Acidimicrobiales bacterium]|nr:hypothetical protein [Acidimicrobiales bacterium]